MSMSEIVSFREIDRRRTTPGDNSAARLVVGMPHLSFGGLSENWLLKETGHIHWQLLAKRVGLRVPDFRDEEDQRLYAAFVGVQVLEAELEEVREHDEIEIVSSLQRVSRTQFLSRHELRCRNHRKAVIEMLSVFLKRATPGSNHAMQRGIVKICDLGWSESEHQEHELARVARVLRADSPDWNVAGFTPTKRKVTASFVFTPCPHGDFNGAEFLYFASFQSIADRAEWDWRCMQPTVPRTEARKIFYYSNVDVGESIEVNRCGWRTGADRLSHWCEFVRKSDAMRIADVFTVRKVHV